MENIIKTFIKTINSCEGGIVRDFYELSNFSSSSSSALKFTNHSLIRNNKNIKEKLSENIFNHHNDDLYKSSYIHDHESELYPQSSEGKQYMIVVNAITNIFNFSHGIRYFFTMIAIVDNTKKRLVTVVLTNPIDKKILWCSEGEGAYLENEDCITSKIKISNRSRKIAFGLNVENGINNRDFSVYKNFFSVLESSDLLTVSNTLINNDPLAGLYMFLSGGYDMSYSVFRSKILVMISILFLNETGANTIYKIQKTNEAKPYYHIFMSGINNAAFLKDIYTKLLIS